MDSGTTCQNTWWKLWRFDWKSWFPSPEGEGTVYDVFELSTQQRESRKVLMCLEAQQKCDFRYNTLGCGPRLPCPCSQTEFLSSGGRDWSEEATLSWAFADGQLYTKVSFFKKNFLVFSDSTEQQKNTVFEPYNNRIYNLTERSILETTHCVSPKDNLLK